MRRSENSKTDELASECEKDRSLISLAPTKKANIRMVSCIKAHNRAGFESFTVYHKRGSKHVKLLH